MAYFAELNDDNVVLRVISVNDNELLDENGNESEQKGIDFCIGLLGGRWIQTSYNTVGNVHRNGKTPFRKNFASVNSRYYPEQDGFACVAPYPSWILNQETFVWEPPVPEPQDGKRHIWKDSILNWVEVYWDTNTQTWLEV